MIFAAKPLQPKERRAFQSPHFLPFALALLPPQCVLALIHINRADGDNTYCGALLMVTRSSLPMLSARMCGAWMTAATASLISRHKV